MFPGIFSLGPVLEIKSGLSHFQLFGETDGTFCAFVQIWPLLAADRGGFGLVSLMYSSGSAGFAFPLGWNTEYGWKEGKSALFDARATLAFISQLVIMQ